MHFLAYYLHDLNPYVFQLYFLRPRWYGIAYLLGFLGAYLLLGKLSRAGMLRINPERVPDLLLNSCIFGVLLGGRFGFVLFYDLPISLSRGQTPMLWDFSSSFPFWGALRVWDGGMSAHGGVVFTILTLAWLARKYRNQGANFINIGDAACMVVAIGLFFGRCANFINGELYGHPTTVPWAVQFPSEIWAPTNNFDTISEAQLLPAQRSIATYLLAHPQELSAADVHTILNSRDHEQLRDDILNSVGPGLDDPAKLDQIRLQLASGFAVFPSELERWDLAAIWQDSTGGLHAAIRTAFALILPPRHPSQLYEALLEGALLFSICWSVGWFWHKDGMASGAFLTFYPVMRIIGEQFRVGDTPENIFGMEISKGILYSLPMFLAGAIYWLYWIRRNRRIPWNAAAIVAEPLNPNP